MGRFFILLIVFAVAVFAAQKNSVFILHSYSQEYGWTKGQNRGFIDTLDRSGHQFEYFVEYLNAKRVKQTEEYQQQFCRYLQMKYKDVTPDAIYVTDDNALLFMVKYRLELFKKDIPIFYSGINDVDYAKALPNDLYKGVYEIQEARQNLKLIQQFSPQTRDIYFVGDDSITYQAIVKNLYKEVSNFPNFRFHYISDSNITKVIAQLPRKQRSFVLLTTIGTLKDENGNSLSPRESIARIHALKNLILMAMEGANMYPGVIGGFVTDSVRQGSFAADLLLKYLQNSSLLQMQNIASGANIYIFDALELRNARIILSEYIQRHALIINKQKDYFEKNKSQILNYFAIIIILFLLIIGILYILQRKKYLEYQKNADKILHLRSKLFFEEALLKNSFELGRIGFWKMNLETRKIDVSDELLNLLGIDQNIYTNDPDIIRYFVHPSDREMFALRVREIEGMNTNLIIQHKMVTSHQKVYLVRHMLYREDMQLDGTRFIVGVIQFEES